MEQIDNMDLFAIRNQKIRRLRILQRQAATYGANAAPAHLLMEIEDLETEIQETEEKLGIGAQGDVRSVQMNYCLWLRDYITKALGYEEINLSLMLRDIDSDTEDVGSYTLNGD